MKLNPYSLLQDPLFQEGYEKAVEILHACATDTGFLASPTRKDNYRRIWARDGVVIGMAGLLIQDPVLVEAMKQTLQTLADHQGPHGEIPSNVDTASGRVSYGGMTGRVDADLWFIIGCGEYWLQTGDDSFLGRILPSLKKVRFLLGAWEFNNRGLLYVPETGDWADEYIHNGFVLYDQLLYLQAFKTLAAVNRRWHDSTDHQLQEDISRLKRLIRANYWFKENDEVPADVYHEILYKKGRTAADRCALQYWAPFFSPHGYGYRFDSLANILVSLLGVADTQQQESVELYIRKNIMIGKEHVMPAFYPVIKPPDHDWEELKMTFSYTFKNQPYQYHNGGLWPMISGFYTADLARRGKTEAAAAHLKEIHRANRLEMESTPWSFPEYVHGADGTAQGTFHQGWSAAGAVIGHFALKDQPFFTVGESDA